MTNLMKLKMKKGGEAAVQILRQQICIKEYFDAEKDVKTRKRALVSKILFNDGIKSTPMTLMLMTEKDARQVKHLFYYPYNDKDESLHTLVHNVSNDQARQLATQLARTCNFIK